MKMMSQNLTDSLTNCRICWSCYSQLNMYWSPSLSSRGRGSQSRRGWPWDCGTSWDSSSCGWRGVWRRHCRRSRGWPPPRASLPQRRTRRGRQSWSCYQEERGETSESERQLMRERDRGRREREWGWVQYYQSHDKYFFQIIFTPGFNWSVKQLICSDLVSLANQLLKYLFLPEVSKAGTYVIGSDRHLCNSYFLQCCEDCCVSTLVKSFYWWHFWIIHSTYAVIIHYLTAGYSIHKIHIE